MGNYFIHRDGQSNTATALGCVAIVEAENAEQAIKLAQEDGEITCYSGQFLTADTEADLAGRYPGEYVDDDEGEHKGEAICSECAVAAENGEFEDRGYESRPCEYECCDRPSVASIYDRGSSSWIHVCATDLREEHNARFIRLRPVDAAPEACWSCVEMARDSAREETCQRTAEHAAEMAAPEDVL